jgi:hypothetical protein
MSDKNGPSWWAEWSKVAREPAALGGLLVTAALMYQHAWVASIGTLAVLLLSTRSVFRELLIAAVLFWATYLGFSNILTKALAAGDIHPGKAAIVIVAILAWSALVALCLGRLLGKREED